MSKFMFTYITRRLDANYTNYMEEETANILLKVCCKKNAVVAFDVAILLARLVEKWI